MFVGKPFFAYSCRYTGENLVWIIFSCWIVASASYTDPWQTFYRLAWIERFLLVSMTLSQGLLLFCAAILGGTLNSVAGGGSFICFPALVFTGLPAIAANATNS